MMYLSRWRNCLAYSTRAATLRSFHTAWVINRLAQPEHFLSAFSDESRRSHATRNAALAPLSAAPPTQASRVNENAWVEQSLCRLYRFGSYDGPIWKLRWGWLNPTRRHGGALNEWVGDTPPPRRERGCQFCPEWSPGAAGGKHQYLGDAVFASIALRSALAVPLCLVIAPLMAESSSCADTRM
jgi:hypothetical protein